jgi:PTS system cellobiose-specific IIC component
MDKLVMIANKLSQNKLIQATSRGIIGTISILMLGSFATLLNTLPIEPYQTFINNTGISSILSQINTVTNGMLCIYTSFSIAYAYVKAENQDPFVAGILSVASFLLLTPTTTVEGGGLTGFTSNLPLTWLDATGLFTSIIVSIITAIIYSYLIKKNITIKMPESVPPFVSQGIVGIIPGIIIIVFFSILSMIFAATPFETIHDAVFELISAPLQNLGGTIWAGLLVYLLSGICWFVGVHGVAVMSAVIPIWFAADQANIASVAAGQEPTNIITYTWLNVVAGVGGAGVTIGLVILCAFFAKSQRYKQIGKLTLIPSFFNINEPVVFGVPCMLNVFLAIPFIFLPVVLIVIAYLLTIIGILPIGNGIGAPAGVPIVLMGAFTGGWRLALWQLVTVFISIGVYFPFFRILDKRALKEEVAELEMNEAILENS